MADGLNSIEKKIYGVARKLATPKIGGEKK